ncbi:MAG: ATP-binding protein [Acidimicrobiales bacterium]
MTEEVRLVLPARPELVGVARLTAASLAGTIDFSLDEIEDLKIAVEELCHRLIGSGSDAGSLTLTYRVGPDTLEIVGTGPKAPDLPSSDPLSERILEAVTDDYALDVGRDLAHFRLVKRRAARV